MAWSQSGNIKGASGQPGASGASGLQGASGVPGATGPTGASGPAGTTTWSGIADKPAVIAAGVDAAAARNVISAEYTGNKGQPSGYAALDASGLVPSSQLPSFVDDVVEAANLAAFPATGESGKIYTALDTNKVYRWGGSSYTEISPSPGSTDAVPEGSTNLYYTAARADGRITAAIGSSVQAYSATLTTYASKTAPTGAVVGTTDTQTLTNKDLSGASNTFPAFIKRSVQTITSSGTTLGASGSTDYVVFANVSGDSALSSVSLLLNMNGTNNSTTFTDNSPSPLTVTANGDAKISTAQSKFGGASALFDGNGDYLSIADTAALEYGSSDLTWEMWIKTTSSDFYDCLMAREPNTTFSAGYYSLMINYASATAGDVVLFINNANASSPFMLTSGASVRDDAWHHIAVVRNGSAWNIYIDGTSRASATWAGSFSDISSPVWIGGNQGYGRWYNGYIDSLRLTKGIARYTGNFTAPTAEFPTVAPTVNLPSASSNTNRYSFRNISGSSLTIGASGSQAINGATGGLSLAASASTELISDGSGWYSF